MLWAFRFSPLLSFAGSVSAFPSLSTWRDTYKGPHTQFDGFNKFRGSPQLTCLHPHATRFEIIPSMDTYLFAPEPFSALGCCRVHNAHTFGLCSTRFAAICSLSFKIFTFQVLFCYIRCFLTALPDREISIPIPPCVVTKFADDYGHLLLVAFYPFHPRVHATMIEAGRYSSVYH